MGTKALDRWMEVALKEARQAAREGEVPVGAVLVREGELLARDHNRSIQRSDPRLTRKSWSCEERESFCPTTD